METKEIWRNVPSVPGLIASSAGYLMVVPYIHELNNHRYGGLPTKGQWDGKRFVYVIKGKTYKAHRLICEAFNGPPWPGAVCMHLDEDASNNRPENLAWGTQKENLNAPGFIEYCKSRTGENSPIKKGMARKTASASTGA
ncbi:HNH endonuclease signature motif containing protein [Metapseudomonas otitidis]|uniref:HNH endonuclease signature motif containing protein n=1 Tax=Metapseudomonas otitidis TaxID=319939 RepID=UPI00244BB38B|nr:HNH endonuclease signature motif containing protein [Pseudomonas otitidis]MDG9785315.1 HNH endonuclease [Pseudomonas otitidis]